MDESRIIIIIPKKPPLGTHPAAVVVYKRELAECVTKNRKGISVFCLGFLDTSSEDRTRVCRIGIEERKGNCAQCARMVT